MRVHSTSREPADLGGCSLCVPPRYGTHGDTTAGVHTGLRVHPRVHRETHSGPARGPAWGSGLRGTCVCVDVAVRRCVCVVVCVRVRVQHLFQWGAVGQAERPSSVGCKSALVLMSSLKEAQIPIGANQDGCRTTQFTVYCRYRCHMR